MPADQDGLEHRHADQDATTAVADMPLRGEILIPSTEVFGIGCARCCGGAPNVTFILI
jgi:hypothetical protein